MEFLTPKGTYTHIYMTYSFYLQQIVPKHFSEGEVQRNFGAPQYPFALIPDGQLALLDRAPGSESRPLPSSLMIPPRLDGSCSCIWWITPLACAKSLVIPKPQATCSRLSLSIGAALTPEATELVQKRATARVAECRVEKYMVEVQSEKEERKRRRCDQRKGWRGKIVKRRRGRK